MTVPGIDDLLDGLARIVSVVQQLTPGEGTR
jgi:hypothetical protein